MPRHGFHIPTGGFHNAPGALNHAFAGAKAPGVFQELPGDHRDRRPLQAEASLRDRELRQLLVVSQLLTSFGSFRRRTAPGDHPKPSPTACQQLLGAPKRPIGDPTRNVLDMLDPVAGS